MNNISFTHQLIKGKIAEIIFEQMINHTKGYTILEFGYEKVVRQLANEPKTKDISETIEVVRRAPDFAVINEKTHEITLIEVKYMSEPTPARTLKTARDIKKSWKRASLFIATPAGFFYDDVDELIAKKGVATPFSHPSITAKTTAAYLDLLKKFIGDN